jgi:AraC-like DNA-binding protein
MNSALFSTAQERPSDRAELWGRQTWSGIGRLHTTVDPGGAFEGTVRFAAAGALKLCEIKVGPHRIERTPELIRRDDAGLLKVVFQLAGRTFLEQGGRQLILAPGQWSVYDTSRPYRAFNHEPIELLALLVPRDRFSGSSFDVRSFGLQALSSETGVGSLLHSFVHTLLKELPAMSQDLYPDLTDTALELLRLAMLEHSRSACPLSAGTVLKERIKLYVRRHLREPGFSIATVAAAMNCSKRYLHKAFGGECQQTLSQYIWSSRLECCRDDLLSPANATKSLTEIAFSWGFNNAAHFSRCFRSRFGSTPSDYRAANSAAPPAQSVGLDSPALPPGQPVPVL